MVIDDICIQYSTKFFLTKTHIYLPLASVQDLIINEVIFGVSHIGFTCLFNFFHFSFKLSVSLTILI